jgi:hypothetical protein
LSDQIPPPDYLSGYFPFLNKLSLGATKKLRFVGLPQDGDFGKSYQTICSVNAPLELFPAYNPC